VIDVRTWNLPFRIGTTSYIIPADLLPNAQFLAAYVQDMQLVLFETPEGGGNLPSPEVVAALAAWGRAHDLTYTVHLLYDLCLEDDGAPSLALAKAREVIDLTRPLEPSAWVCHLDGRSMRDEPAQSPQFCAWQEQAAAALQEVCSYAGAGQQVAVENLERYPPDFITPVVARTAAGRCLDAGHLWLDGVDPLPHLAAALPRLQVVHLHGVQPVFDPQSGRPLRGRDHSSLALADPHALAAALRLLLAARYRGVVCLEIFEEDDFWSSLHALADAVGKVSRV
jgi:sugar phosphate isomerase/epimerase